MELAEVSEIFKQQVTLFDARTHEAPAALPLRRAHSVGPGIGFDRSGWSPANIPPAAETGQAKGKEREMAAALAKSVGKAAAKAGSVMLPPTLLRDLANSRPPKDKDKDGGKQYCQWQTLSSTSSKKRFASQPNQPTENVFTSAVSKPPRNTPCFDPPPIYQSALIPPAFETSGSSSPSPSLTFQSRAASTPSSPTAAGSQCPDRAHLPAQSCPAAGPHSGSILHASRDPEHSTGLNGVEPSGTNTQFASALAASALDGVERAGTDTRLDGLSVDDSMQSRSSSNRTRAESALQIIRFKPRDLGPIATSFGGVQLRRQGRSCRPSRSDVAMAADRHVVTVLSASAPSPIRTSLDFVGENIASSTLERGPNENRKSKAGGFNTQGVNSSSGIKSSRLGVKKSVGLKSLLGGLRKEDQPTKIGSTATPSARVASPASTSASSSSSSPPSSHRHGQSATVMPRHSAEASHMAARQLLSSYSAPPDFREFKKGTYTYSISLSLPANLPPTLYADFGRNTYALKALVRRSGPLTPNLSCEREVVMVHAPDEEGIEETEAIIVERSWEEALTYRVFVSGRSFACGSKIPLWIKFIPLGEKIRLWRFTAVLEEKTNYYAKGRKVARHESPRRWSLLKLVGEEGRPLLPIISDRPDAMRRSPLAEHAIAAAGFRLPGGTRRGAAMDSANGSRPSSPSAAASRLAQGQESDSNDDEDDCDDEEASQDALASLLDPTGPWELSIDLQLPGAGTKMNISTDHAKSSITVHHLLRLTFRVEKASGDFKQGGSGAKPKLFDIFIECPISINHSRTSDIWLSLPNYWSVAGLSESPLHPDAATIEDGADSYFLPRRPQTPGTSSGLVTPGGTRGEPLQASPLGSPHSYHWCKPEEHHRQPQRSSRVDRVEGRGRQLGSAGHSSALSTASTAPITSDSAPASSSELEGGGNDAQKSASQWMQLSLEAAGGGPEATPISVRQGSHYEGASAFPLSLATSPLSPNNLARSTTTTTIYPTLGETDTLPPPYS